MDFNLYDLHDLLYDIHEYHGPLSPKLVQKQGPLQILRKTCSHSKDLGQTEVKLAKYLSLFFGKTMHSLQKHMIT